MNMVHWLRATLKVYIIFSADMHVNHAEEFSMLGLHATSCEYYLFFL
jgi:hypothetical protein